MLNEEAAADETSETTQNELSLADEVDKTKDDGGEEKTTEGGEEAKKDEGDAGGEEAPKLPESADQYDFTLPDVGLKDEKGEVFQFDPADPFVGEARELFFKHKIPQDALSEIMGLYARMTLDTQNAATEMSAEAKEQQEAAKTAELGKLKTTGADGKEISGETRVDNLLKRFNSYGGDGASKKIAPTLTTADDVIFFEKLLDAALAKPGANPKPGGESATEGLRGADRLAAMRAGN